MRLLPFAAVKQGSPLPSQNFSARTRDSLTLHRAEKPPGSCAQTVLISAQCSPRGWIFLLFPPPYRHSPMLFTCRCSPHRTPLPARGKPSTLPFALRFVVQPALRHKPNTQQRNPPRPLPRSTSDLRKQHAARSAPQGSDLQPHQRESLQIIISAQTLFFFL